MSKTGPVLPPQATPDFQVLIFFLGLNKSAEQRGVIGLETLT